ncbi:VOC family protein (plasmid) [Haloterrigena salifodinae]|uniref:VOC family protein n=1 Tax=Haloterrigena salifodinae TaxID=2675099 RepID=A0A8T8E719_9EURY|nr:VOC family protein [Haloterrigena salifodinae]QRV17665.1 VOC family protein [Haloterrigena salifodinae]
MFERIHHIAILIGGVEREIDEYTAVFEDDFGMERIQKVHFEDDHCEVALYSVGETIIEFTSPTGERGWHYEHLQEHGPGFFHIAFEVDDIEQRRAELEELGYGFVDEIRDGIDWKITTFDYHDTPLPMQIVEDPRPVDERA